MVRGPLTRDDRGPADPRYLAVHGVRRFERHRRPSASSEGQTQGLQDLIGAVRNKDLVGSNVVEPGDGTPEFGRRSVRVAVELDQLHGLGQPLLPGGRWREGALVGVEPHRDIDLRRVISLHDPDLRAGCNGETLGHPKRLDAVSP